MRATQPASAGAHFAAAWRRLCAFITNYRLALAWPLGTAVLCALGWYFLLTYLEEEKRALDKRALQVAEVLAGNYADQLKRAVEAIDQTALHVKYEWEISGGQLRLTDAKAAGLFPSESILYASIVDPSGKILSTTRAGPHQAFIDDGIHLLIQKNAQRDFLYMDDPASDRPGERRSLVFSRRLQDRDGSFAGAVLIAVAPAYFMVGYNQAVFMDHGFLGIAGAEGAVWVTRVGDAIHGRYGAALLAAPELPAPSGSMLLDGRMWFRDARTRYVGWQSLDRYPVTALAGLDRQEYLAPYRETRANSIEGGLLATLAAALFAVVASALSLRLASKKRQFEVLQATYRKATEGGNEGFYITRPIYDKTGAIVDFKIIDCNRRGAELVRLPREALIGKRTSDLYQEPARSVRMSILRQAMETGFYEGEIERPDQSYPAHWVKLKIVRHGGDLAVSARDISEEKAYLAELHRRSNEDILTGLPNRHWVAACLPRALERAAASGSMLALLFIDLDGFKVVNDRFGHAGGDEVLRSAARRLKETVRPHDCVARFGGDEFIAILEHIEDRNEAARAAAHVLDAFREGFRLPQGEQQLGASIGISVFPGDGAEAQTLLRNADIAMYSVKTTGRRNYRFYDENFYEALRLRREREAELRTAIEQDQFIIHYQPRVDLATGTTSSMEALVRWEHPVKGPICPLEFIPLAEETGLILSLGELVVDKVCAQMAGWMRKGTPLVPVSVNVSPRQFNEADVAGLLSQALARHGVDPQLIEVELTESSVMNDSADVAGALNAIRTMGIKVLVDDFGTGYSSLSQLQRLDFDGLKVDQAFTAQLEQSAEGGVFFKAIITMAHALGMKVVVEGVETAGQIEILKTLNCDEIQGYFVSRPLPPSDTQPTLPKLESV